MIKTLMISAAVSALMVSGALAQADMSKQPAAKTDAAPAVPHDWRRERTSGFSPSSKVPMSSAPTTRTSAM
jgi:hypothetical protein